MQKSSCTNHPVDETFWNKHFHCGMRLCYSWQCQAGRTQSSTTHHAAHRFLKHNRCSSSSGSKWKKPLASPTNLERSSIQLLWHWLLLETQFTFTFSTACVCRKQHLKWAQNFHLKASFNGILNCLRRWIHCVCFLH